MASDKVLVIGYGSDLRGDDGVGPHIAARLSAAGLEGVRALAVRQLTPELAEPIASAQGVVFLDAEVEPEPSRGCVRVERVYPMSQQSSIGHAGDPRVLLALSQALYGRSPAAWLVTVPVDDVGLGRPLSPKARRRAGVALRHVRRLLSTLTCGGAVRYQARGEACRVGGAHDA